jgi:hypothetical protein
MADQAGDAHGRRAAERRLRRVRLGQADAFRVHGQADIAQQLGQGGAFVEGSRDVGAFARVDVGHGSPPRAKFHVVGEDALVPRREPTTPTHLTLRHLVASHSAERRHQPQPRRPVLLEVDQELGEPRGVVALMQPT